MSTSSTSEAVTLREHTEVTDVGLSGDQARALAAFRFTPVGAAQRGTSPVVAVSPGSTAGRYNLRPGSIVGTLSVAGLQVNILPKAGVGKTGQMLAYSLGLARFLRDSAAFTDATSFPALLVPAFLSQTSSILREGLVEDYVPMVETGTRPRGRINIQSLARSGLPAPVKYTYDDFVSDTPLNRLLARALHAISDMQSLPPEFHAEARSLLGPFSDVAFVDHPDLYHGEALPDRVGHYRDALTLATLILEGSGIEPIRSSRRARGLLFDMNKVFEDFVTAVVRAAAPAGRSVDSQGSLHPTYLDAERRFRLKPDFAVWDRFGCRLVGDVKYKTLDAQKGPRRPDLYQMVSYAAAAGAERALLVYVGAGPGTDVDVTFPQVKIEVRAVDIDQELPEIERQISALINVG